MDRDSALQAARERFETPIWAILSELEATLRGLATVRHVDLSDARAVGSVLNCALTEAAGQVGDDLEIAYCRNGQSNKVTGSMMLAGEDHSVSFELHLSGPRGGTSKASHQFADYDIEQEPTFPGFEMEAPPSLLLFIACYLSGTGMRIERAFLKFADGVDQSKIEIFRNARPEAAGAADGGPTEGPDGTRLKIKKPMGEEENHGSETDKRGNAASSSKKT